MITRASAPPRPVVHTPQGDAARAALGTEGHVAPQPSEPEEAK